MLLLRGARAASAWAASTAVAAGASGGRSISVRLTPVAALSSGGRKRKGQRRGEAKPPSPPPPPPQPLPRQSEAPSSKKKSGARPSGEARKSRPVELGEARGPRRPDGGEARKGNTQPQPQPQPQEKAKVKRLVRWKCASGCGACCKLDKGPDFPTPDEIFADHQDDLQLYRSMIGDDGWCINYDKASRTCNIYQDRPSFCRVEPKVFDEFFGVPRSRFDREACSACVDNIKMVYGDDSAELSNFKRVIREESNKLETKNQNKLLDA